MIKAFIHLHGKSFYTFTRPNLLYIYTTKAFIHLHDKSFYTFTREELLYTYSTRAFIHLHDKRIVAHLKPCNA